MELDCQSSVELSCLRCTEGNVLTRIPTQYSCSGFILNNTWFSATWRSCQFCFLSVSELYIGPYNRTYRTYQHKKNSVALFPYANLFCFDCRSRLGASYSSRLRSTWETSTPSVGLLRYFDRLSAYEFKLLGKTFAMPCVFRAQRQGIS